jgi:low temperature requirement protein LtrA
MSAQKLTFAVVDGRLTPSKFGEKIEGTRSRLGATRIGGDRWMMGHFPIALGIAATGAAMVSLIDHADDSSTPAPTAWLLTGTVALALIALALVTASLSDSERVPQVFGPLRWALFIAAFATLGLGWMRPAPWVLALGLWAVLSVVWFYAILRWVKHTDPEEHIPTFGEG